MSDNLTAENKTRIIDIINDFFGGGLEDIIEEMPKLRAENEKLKKELDFAIKGVEKYEAIIDAAKEQAKDDLSKKLREANGYLFRDWKENARLMWQAAEEIEKLRKTLEDK